ncbi:MAG: hypothetical protein HDS97_05695 [Bacteroidales bacterium]|nr:hypothetical protein [Bacteroidales bacterium]MDE6256959.1 hypothetical protein [Muribaculaceae bacterium]
MIKNKKLILIAVVAIAVIAIGLYFSFASPKKSIDVSKGQISKVETMAQLCAIDIYSEVPILDTINNKVMFAVQKQKGSVSFDLENMQMDSDGDTVKIVLSPEIVDLYEATEDNSWEVIDTKAIGKMAMFKSDKFTNEEENAIKANIKKNSKKLLYHNGTIERARAEGARNLQTLMEKVYQKPVKVVDPTPKGAHYEDFK